MKHGKSKRILASALAAMLSLSTLTGGMMTGSAQEAAGNIGVYDLTVEYVSEPLGIDVEAPRFGWKMDSNLIGAAQTAYQVVIKDEAGKVAYDSGKVASDASVGVAQDAGLAPETDYTYSVTVWDNYGNVSTSESSFSTGVDSWGDAQWISPGETDYAVSMMRSPETAIANKEVKDAKLYMTSLGIFKAYINGETVLDSKGETFGDPGWVDYDEYIKYMTFDVTNMIKGDKLVLSAEVGRGWYKSGISGRGGANSYDNVFVREGAGKRDLALFGKLVIEYADGEKQVIDTGADWIFNNDGPIYNADYYTGGSISPVPDTDPTKNLNVDENGNLIDGVTYGGEKYDANKEVDGWNVPGFAADEAWNTVYVGTVDSRIESMNGAATAYYNTKYDFGIADAYIYKPENNTEPGIGLDGKENPDVVWGSITREATYKEGDEITVNPGERLIVNFGQNIAGVIETVMEGQKDGYIVFSHVEMMNDGRENPNYDPSKAGSTGPAGTIYYANLRGEKTAVYKFGQDGEVTYRPDFTFFGFQQVQIMVTKPVTIKDITAKPITSALNETGNVETNVPELNKLVSNVKWSTMDNFLSIPTDCPQRNERCGWTGDIMLFSGTATFLYDVAAFLQHYVQICDEWAAINNDRYTAIMPAQQSYGTNLSCGWSDVGVILPWTLWQQTGDIAIIEKSFDQMDKYMDAVGPNGQNYHKSMYGDWVALQACSLQFLNAAFRAYDAQLMAQMAEVLGYEDKVAKYNAAFEETKEFMMNKYYDAEGNLLSCTADGYAVGSPSNNSGEYVDNSQTAISWMLKLGFYRDENHKAFLLDRVMESIHNENGSFRPGKAEDTMAVGFLGLNTIMPALSGAGATDYAYKLLCQDQFPSWIYSVKSGATSIWERWNSYSMDESFLPTSMNSFNHFSFGAVLEWMFTEVAGIQRDQMNPGFKNTILAPKMDKNGQINDVKGSYDSYYGMIKSNWTSANAGELTSYSAVVPANTTATLYLPIEAKDVIVNTSGVKYVGDDIYGGEICAKFDVVAGGYDVTIEDGVVTVNTMDGYVDTDANAPVKSATAPESAQVNADFDVTVVTAASVADVRLFNANGLAIGHKAVDVIDNEDGTKTWTITTALGTVGDARELKVVTKDASGILTDSGVSVSVNITSIPPVLMGFDVPDSAVANRTFIVKATTDMAATKINVYNENGMKMGIKSLSYKIVDGQKEWTAVMSIGTKGERTFTAYAVNKFGAQSDALTDNISVKAFA
ncbi:MAG: family 78 glycoside hydrolase catalytic domain [Clostridiales bacterium]|nr:family 78 glycoside hydrolase catalytic domain [Clostridiales bacterium]